MFITKPSNYTNYIFASVQAEKRANVFTEPIFSARRSSFNHFNFSFLLCEKLNRIVTHIFTLHVTTSPATCLQRLLAMVSYYLA